MVPSARMAAACRCYGPHGRGGEGSGDHFAADGRAASTGKREGGGGEERARRGGRDHTRVSFAVLPPAPTLAAGWKGERSEEQYTHDTRDTAGWTDPAVRHQSRACRGRHTTSLLTAGVTAAATVFATRLLGTSVADGCRKRRRSSRPRTARTGRRRGLTLALAWPPFLPLWRGNTPAPHATPPRGSTRQAEEGGRGRPATWYTHQRWWCGVVVLGGGRGRGCD